MSSLSPIALFVYNRIDHTKQTIEALKKNVLAKESDLFIFSDGAKNMENEKKILELRDYLKTIGGFKTIAIIESEFNKGLANSIIDGVTEIVNKYGKIIVLEDDLVTAPQFLRYMNKNLENYERVEDVISIHGYNYPIESIEKHFFLKGADCWGWATWKRGWDLFEKNGEILLTELKRKNKVKEFNFNNSYNYLGMLEDFIEGKNSSWAIRWYASAFLNDKYTLYPGKSLVMNIGFDNTGTHCGSEEYLNYNNFDFPLESYQDKIEIIENKKNKERIEKYFNSLKKRKKIFIRILKKIKNIFIKILKK